jgi:hypothetical protein
MRDAIVYLLLLMTLAAAWGALKPYAGLRRRWFALGAPAFFLAAAIAVPQPTDEKLSQRKAIGSEKIAEKARKADEEIANYQRATHAEVYKLVGEPMFSKLGELEFGARLFAAGSSYCDKVWKSDISLRLSERDRPVWLVDCVNQNRFLVDLDQGEAALIQKSEFSLVASDIKPHCSYKSLELCKANKVQRAADRSDVVSRCNLIVKDVAIGDVDIEWGYDYSFSDGDRIQVTRNFKAVNGFGANLKHRYICYFDAGRGRVTELSIMGPFGTKRII